MLFIVFATGCNTYEEVTTLKTGESESWKVDLIQQRGKVGSEIVVTPDESLNQIDNFSINIDLDESSLKYEKSTVESGSEVCLSIPEQELDLYEDEDSINVDILWNESEKEKLVIE